MKTDLDAVMIIEGDGEDPEAYLEAFAQLIKSGTCWTLQGFYGRTANGLIEAGIISPEGEVTEEGRATLEEFKPVLTKVLRTF